MVSRFTDKYGAGLWIKNTPDNSCCLRITDSSDQAFFVIKPEDGEEIIAMIKAQLRLE